MSLLLWALSRLRVSGLGPGLRQDRIGMGRSDPSRWTFIVQIGGALAYIRKSFGSHFFTPSHLVYLKAQRVV